DGDDVLRVHARISEAVDRARESSEPTMVEIKTYRFRGHSMSDPGQYRTKEEVEEWKKRDPVSIGRRRLVEEAGRDEAACKVLEAKVKAEIDDAVKFAEESPPADEYKSFTYKD